MCSDAFPSPPVLKVPGNYDWRILRVLRNCPVCGCNVYTFTQPALRFQVACHECGTIFSVGEGVAYPVVEVGGTGYA